MGCAIDWPLAFQGLKTFLDPLAVASWPIAILAIFWLFRRNIKLLLGRIRFLKGAGLEAELQSEGQQERALSASEPASVLPTGFGTEFPAPHLVYSEFDDSARNILNEAISGDADKKLAWAIRMRSISEASRLHEAHYRIIFGSQLRALKHLNLLGKAPASLFEPFFRQAASDPATASIHEGHDFEQWGQFLINSGYVQIVSESDPIEVEITAFGQQFLIWLTEARVSELRPG